MPSPGLNRESLFGLASEFRSLPEQPNSCWAESSSGWRRALVLYVPPPRGRACCGACSLHTEKRPLVHTEQEPPASPPHPPPSCTLQSLWVCGSAKRLQDTRICNSRVGYRVCACTEPHAKRDAAVLLGGKQGRVETAPAALIPEGRMRRNKALNDSKNYLEAARLRGKISSGSSGWTAPTSGTCLCTH